MFRRIKDNLASRVSPTGQHLSGLRADLRSRLDWFRHHRSVPEQTVLTEDFSMVLEAWGIDDATEIPGVVRALRLRILIFAAPVLVCAIAGLSLRDFISCLALAFISLPCLFGILSTVWRIAVLKKRHFLPLSRWLLSGFGVFGKRP
jgi:hypothetical protein